jgi:hypothetical protein
MEQNIAKLKARYPQGWTMKNFADRNLEAEAAVFQKVKDDDLAYPFRHAPLRK